MNGQCTRRWEELELVRDNPRVRFCSVCQSAVHLAEHETEMRELARVGKNVAVLRDAPAVDGNATIPSASDRVV
jgi:hypothetical protein